MTKINFGDVADNEFDALPEDRYTVEVVEAKMGESKAGNQKITCQFKVTEGDYENRRLFNDFSLVQKAWFNLKNYFTAAGVDISGEIDFDDLPGLLKGTKTSVWVTQEEYNGKPQNRLNQWTSLDAGAGSMFK
ncbi:MAG: DUF669 domain-containing protein [Candidatus Brocadiales bacterium]|nr:DUF669 domain-containing protein [Candidatus Brocadiales bacterium]